MKACESTSSAPESALAIVRCPQGAWRWQTPYVVSAYRPHATRDGRLVWRLARRETRKMTLARCLAYAPGARVGSLHNRPVAL